MWTRKPSVLFAKAIRNATPVKEGPIRYAREMVELRPSLHSEDDAQWANQAQQRKRRGDNVAFLDQVRAGRISEVQALGGKPLYGEVQVITLGNDLAWVGLPGEIFFELGMALKIFGSGAKAVISQDRQNAPSLGAIQLHPMISRFAQNGRMGRKARACGS